MNGTTTCHRCGNRLRVPATVADPIVTCPRCLTLLANPNQGGAAGGLATDVRRDLSAASVVLFVLIGLCVAGILVIFLTTSTEGHLNLALPIYLMFAFAVLDLLVIVAGLRWLWVRASSSTISLGRVALYFFLSVGVILGVIIVFFVACWGLMATREAIDRRAAIFPETLRRDFP